MMADGTLLEVKSVDYCLWIITSNRAFWQDHRMIFVTIFWEILFRERHPWKAHKGN